MEYRPIDLLASDSSRKRLRCRFRLIFVSLQVLHDVTRGVGPYLPMAQLSRDQFGGVLFKNGNLILKIIYE